MKLQSKKKVRAKTCELGGSRYRVFGSMTPENAEALRRQLNLPCVGTLDVLEIVLNQYGALNRFAEDLAACVSLEIPISLRIKEQGADDPVDKTLGLAVLEDCVRKGLADFVDIEPEDSGFVSQVKALLSGTGVKLILTRQNYRGVGSKEEVLQAAQAVEAMGPALTRVLYLAVDDVDMLHIAQAARSAKQQGMLETPFCISAIGEAGLMLRLFGERCGNDFGSYPLSRKANEGMALETLDECRKLRRIYAIDHEYDGDGDGT